MTFTEKYIKLEHKMITQNQNTAEKLCEFRYDQTQEGTYQEATVHQFFRNPMN